MGQFSRKHRQGAKAFETPGPLLDVGKVLNTGFDHEVWEFRSVCSRWAHAINTMPDSRNVLSTGTFETVFLSDRHTGPAFGKAAYDVLRRWGDTDVPGLPAIVLRACDKFGVSEADKVPVVMAAILGSHDSGLDYHNASHNRKVLLQSLRLLSAAKDINPSDKAKMMIAACIHDLGHTGSGNMIDGRHKPFLLENRAVELARPYLNAAGLSKKDYEEVKALVLATDVSPMGSPLSPARLVCAQGAVTLPAELHLLMTSPVLMRLARFLGAADIATSAAICCEQSFQESLSVAHEHKRADLSTLTRDFDFFSKACTPALTATPEAARVYGGNAEFIQLNLGRYVDDMARTMKPALKMQ